MWRRWEAECQEHMQGQNRVRQTRLAEIMVPIENLFPEMDGQQAPQMPENDGLMQSPQRHPAEMDVKQGVSGLSAFEVY